MTNSAVSTKASAWAVVAEDSDFKPLTRDEAQQLRLAHPSTSPWVVVSGQLLVGVLVACAAWLLTGRQSAGWSALYGALAVVIPGALFARGLMSQFSSINAMTAGFGFCVGGDQDRRQRWNAVCSPALGPRSGMVGNADWPDRDPEGVLGGAVNAP